MDEIYQAVYSQLSFSEIVHHLSRTDVSPPFYFWLTHIWIQIGGTSEAWLRLLPALFGVCSLGLIYQLAKIWRDQEVATMTLAIWATFLPAVYYSREVRFYSFLTTGALAAQICCVRIFQLKDHPQTASWVMALNLLSMALATSHQVWIIAYYLVILPLTWKSQIRTRTTQLSLFFFAAVSVISILFSISNILSPTGALNWIEWQGLSSCLSDILDYFAIGTRPVSWALWAATGVFVLKSLYNGTSSDRLISLLFLVPTVTLIGISACIKPLFTLRYMMMFSPALALVCADALVSLLRPLRLVPLGIVFCGITLTWHFLMEQKFFTFHRKPDTREVFHFLAQEKPKTLMSQLLEYEHQFYDPENVVHAGPQFYRLSFKLEHPSIHDLNWLLEKSFDQPVWVILRTNKYHFFEIPPGSPLEVSEPAKFRAFRVLRVARRRSGPTESHSSLDTSALAAEGSDKQEP